MSRPACLFYLSLVLAGCASTPAPAPGPSAGSAAVVPAPAPASVAPRLPHYTCDQGLAFDARFADGSVDLLFATREPETLLRDAGGTSPEQVVYSSTALKAEFGLVPDGRGVKLNFVTPAMSATCMRE